jgi:hypothetical protein
MNNNIIYNAFFKYTNLLYINKNIESIDDDRKKFEDKNRQILGYYDTKNKLWYNSWAIASTDKIKKNFFKKSKELLIYALDIDTNLSISEPLRVIIKSILVSSKIIIQEKLQLDLILAISMYLLKTDYITREIEHDNQSIEIYCLYF